MENNIMQAQKAYAGFCKMLDNQEWSYEKDDEKMLITTGARGDDLPIPLKIKVDAERMLIQVYSMLNFGVPEEQLVSAALSVCIINYALSDGCFDLDVTDGSIIFRMSMAFRDSLLSEAAYDYFIKFAVYVVDEYNDKLLMVTKGKLTPQQLLEDIKG